MRKKLINESKWNKFLNEKKEISDQRKAQIVIDIIDRHCKNPDPPEVDIKPLRSVKVKFQGMHVSTNAAYIPGMNLILLDVDAFNHDFGQVIEDVLHELTHANQEYRWQSFSLADKKKFLQGKKIPANVDLESLTYRQLSDFWNKAYSYDNDPDEIEARKYAARNFAKEFDRFMS